MNGTDASGVHDSMEAIVTSEAAEPATFEAFFDAEKARLLRALYLLTGNREEAEELMQDAFIAVWERWDRVVAMEDPTGYLFRTALNRYRSGVRRAARAARRAVGLAHGGDGFEDADARIAVGAALTKLSARRREAIVLTELLGYGSAEAGRIMGVADATVRRLAQDARAELRTSLEVDDA
jgi:RNA polymerase sigma factor (sigma-70 family)